MGVCLEQIIGTDREEVVINGTSEAESNELFSLLDVDG